MASLFGLTLLIILAVVAEDTPTPTPTPTPHTPTPTPSHTPVPTPTPTPMPPNPHGPMPAIILFDVWEEDPDTPPKEDCRSANHTITKWMKNQKDLCQKIPNTEFYFKGFCSPKQFPDLHGVICKQKNCTEYADPNRSKKQLHDSVFPCHSYPWTLPGTCDTRGRDDSPFPKKHFAYYCETEPYGWPIWGFVIMAIGALAVLGTVGYLGYVYCFGRKEAYEQIN